MEAPTRVEKALMGNDNPCSQVPLPIAALSSGRETIKGGKVLYTHQKFIQEAARVGLVLTFVILLYNFQ